MAEPTREQLRQAWDKISKSMGDVIRAEMLRAVVQDAAPVGMAPGTCMAAQLHEILVAATILARELPEEAVACAELEAAEECGDGLTPVRFRDGRPLNVQAVPRVAAPPMVVHCKDIAELRQVLQNMGAPKDFVESLTQEDPKTTEFKN